MNAIFSYYDPVLVILSFVMAFIASYAALDLAQRVTPTASPKSRLIWTCCGAVIMGTGIWSMHFIAMLAFKLPLAVNYNIPLTLLSWVEGIVASGSALLLLSRPQLNLWVLGGGGALMGLAIASMHYLGMAAMQVEARVHLNSWLVILSLGIAFAASSTALWLGFRCRYSQKTGFSYQKLGGAFTMSIAISAMHYTGMAATHFTPIAEAKVTTSHEASWLTLQISAATIVFLVGTLLTLTFLFERRYTDQVFKQQIFEELAEERLHLQNLLAAGPGIIYSCKAQDNFDMIFVSENFATILGYEPEEPLTQKDFWISRIHPEDIDRILAELSQLFVKGHHTHEYRFLHKDGTYRWMYDQLQLVQDETGNPLKCVGYSMDISERKQAELALQQQLKKERLLNSTLEHIRSLLNLEEVLQTAVAEVRQFLATDRTIIYRFNPDWSGFVIVESTAPSIPTILKTSIHDPCFGERYVSVYQKGHICAIENINTSNLAPCHIELLRKFDIAANLVVPILQGENLWGLLIAHHCHSPRQWHPSEIDSLQQISVQLAIAIQQCTLFEHAQTEIAERKQAEAALQKAVSAADAANRAKSEFLASMSHELRTPLNAILGFSQVMVRDSSLKTEHQQYLEIINRAGEHLLSLINDILEMSKIEAGRTRLNESSFNLALLLKNLENMLRLKAESKRLELIFEIPDNLPTIVKADEGKLRQVLINILGNAIKFTEQGNVTLKVFAMQSASTTESSQPLTLHFQVCDTGPGIAPGEMDRLFEAFGQTASGYQSKQGTGLGLPISRKFVQLMGGDINVSSTLGVGSQFSFEIQASVADISDSNLVPELEQKVIGLEPNQSEYRILVVDDRLESRLVLVTLFSSIGLSVKEAENGQQAIDIWENWQPHLIWMDMQMPVMDGYTATKQIKAHPLGKNTIIIALTASAFEEERQEILAAGCDDLVHKPFQEKIVFEKMEKLLGVRYIYEKSVYLKSDKSTPNPGASKHQSIALQLSQMPTKWVDQLSHAAKECCDTKILELVGDIPPEIPDLADELIFLANDFLFEAILEITQSLGKE